MLFEGIYIIYLLYIILSVLISVTSYNENIDLMVETRANESAHPGCGVVASVSSTLHTSGLLFPVH